MTSCRYLRTTSHAPRAPPPLPRQYTPCPRIASLSVPRRTSPRERRRVLFVPAERRPNESCTRPVAAFACPLSHYTPPPAATRRQSSCADSAAPHLLPSPASALSHRAAFCAIPSSSHTLALCCCYCTHTAPSLSHPTSLPCFPVPSRARFPTLVSTFPSPLAVRRCFSLPLEPRADCTSVHRRRTPRRAWAARHAAAPLQEEGHRAMRPCRGAVIRAPRRSRTRRWRNSRRCRCGRRRTVEG